MRRPGGQCMATTLFLTEDDLQNDFADLRPSSDPEIARHLPNLYQAAERDGKFYLIHDWRGRPLPCTATEHTIFAIEFETDEARQRELGKLDALRKNGQVSALLGNLADRSVLSLRDRSRRRKWGKSREDRRGDGGAPVPAPVKPKPPQRPTKDAKHPPPPMD